ncbi:CD4-1 molecule isoform X2 [Misgurnus anguillicaudatus]|uniref:CD4-1 molecule isoform X1 n=1 Tax=Misgurnus anguillicaudatus TaxID=75329 RepID=UPI003CCFD993
MMLCWILILLTLRFLKAEEIEIYAQEGGTVTLPRDLHGGAVANTEKVYVNWFSGPEKTLVISRNPQAGIQPGKDKTRFSLSPDFSVQISPVHESDFGFFSCEQHKFTETYIKTYRLRHVTVSRPQAVMVGDPLPLKCELEKGQLSGTAIVKWTPPKGCNVNIQGSNGEITVPKVPVCASGVWTCTVKYNKREVRATTAAYVIDLSAPSDPIYTSVSNSSSVNIPCSLSNDIPWDLLRDHLLKGSWNFSSLSNANQQPKDVLTLHINSTIKWIPTKDAPIAVQQRELKDKDLSIIKLPVSEAIRGEYTCALNFKGRNFSKKIKVEVLHVTSTATRSPLIEGQRVNLSCSLGHNTTHEVKWRRPSGSTHPLLSSSPHSAFLSFPVRMEDKGKWTCELWDDQKLLTFSDIFLRIEKAPVNIWLWVAISSGIVVFILLLVVIIKAIRKHKQMLMYRRRKTRFCCCKNPNETGFYKT